MEAVFLTKFAKTVALIHRRDQFRGAKIVQERVFANSKIKVHWNSVVESLLGDKDLEGIVLRNVNDGSTSTLKVEGLFVSVGTDPTSDIARGILKLNPSGEIMVDARMATSEPGIYAAGDVIDGCSHQVATAVGSGVQAALSVDEYLSS
jgi:thioredoxin reductase (NADPH)